jgi:predicted secreted Zn-dependent protease
MERSTAPEGLAWRVSRTCDGGACVMVARDGEFILFGSTTQPDGPKLSYTRAEVKEFIAGVRRGEFDDLF